ncbi:MAG TPA: methyltransferase domain-containing protein [Acidimicrobiales bacterium]|nr:methyltransferase domain-containing protein [Acidimicrobiales bacterium]
MPENRDRYSHGHHESVLRSHTWRSAENSAGFLLPHLRPGQELLDVGCGPGTITVDLARRVAPGRVIGVDLSSEVIEVARSSNAPLAPTVSFEVADVYGLPFADGSFDVVYMHQVLQHLSNPIGACAEIRRVLRVGGIAAMRESDYAAFAWAPEDPRLDRWMALYHDITRANDAQADAGRYLPAWVRAAGFSDVTVTSSTWTYQSPEECQWWGQLWADRVQHSNFAVHGLEYGLTTEAELADIADAFTQWASDENALFIVPSVEVIARR